MEILADVAAFELAGEIRPFSAPGEYLTTRVARNGGDGLDFSGWYAQLTCTLTGEPRPYRADRGYCDGIKPQCSRRRPLTRAP